MKEVVVDLVATALIVVAVIWEPGWAMWIVYIYTPLLLVLKVFALLGRGLSQLIPVEDDVPRWFYHLLYAVNTILLLVWGWWGVGLQWLAIWALSAVDVYWRRGSPMPRKTNPR